MDLSILILSYNTRTVTIECLESIFSSLLNAPFTYEVIVLDNNSQDSSVEDIKNKFPQVLLLEKKENLGFGKGNNELAQIAKGKNLLFLNSDIIVVKDAIEKLFTFFEDHNNTYSFVGGKLFNQDGSPQYSAAPFFTLPVVFAVHFLRGDYWGLTRYSPTTIRRVDWLSGACVMVRKNVFLELEGFDEAIFMYMEEVDLMYRAKQKGYITAFYPAAHFIHYGSLSSNGRTDPILNVYRGFLYFYRKHYGTTELFMLKFMLLVKAVVAYSIGVLIHNNYLEKTYDKAIKLVQES